MEKSAERVHRKEERWYLKGLGMEAEREDRKLQAVCYKAWDETEVLSFSCFLSGYFITETRKVTNTDDFNC